jgi:hypothetical protein
VPDQKDNEEEIMRIIDARFTVRVDVHPTLSSIAFQNFVANSTARRRRQSLAA